MFVATFDYNDEREMYLDSITPYELRFLYRTTRYVSRVHGNEKRKYESSVSGSL